MNKLFSGILFSLQMFCYAQDNSQGPINSFDFHYGQVWFQNSFQGIRTFTSEQGIMPAYGGISLNAEMSADTLRTRFYPAQLNVHFILPDQFYFNDTLLLEMNGYFIGYPMPGYDFIKGTDKADLNLIPGLEFGRVRLKQDNGYSLRNGIIGLKLMVQQRVCLRKLVFSLNASYIFDVSQPNWKKLHFGKLPEYTLPNYRFHGLWFSFSFGLRIV